MGKARELSTSGSSEVGGPGDARCGDAFAQIYAELRCIAANHFQNQPVNSTLQPTALVHEAFLKLANRGGMVTDDPDHFVAIAATAMRQILVDHARTKLAGKRGGPGRGERSSEQANGARRRTPMTDSIEQPVGALSLDDLLSLDEALDRLVALDRQGRKVRIVEMRFFGGLSVDEVARVLRVSPETVKKDWQFIKKWLRQAIDGRCP